MKSEFLLNCANPDSGNKGATMAQDSPTNEMDNQETVEKPIPDLYTNSAQFALSVFDVTITFGMRKHQDRPIEDVAIIRMSPQHALVMGKMLMEQLKKYEQQMGKINIPDAVYQKSVIKEDASNGSDTELRDQQAENLPTRS